MSDLGYKQLPGPGWQAGRPYLFRCHKDGSGIDCEDINISAALLCRCYKYVNGKQEREYIPGRFDGTLLGRVTSAGETIFLFVIAGKSEDLWEEKQLFHAGALRLDPAEYKTKRNLLLDALREAKLEAEKMDRVIQKQNDDA
jgi:hypothetical protein